DSRYVLEASQPYALKTAELVRYDTDQVTLDVVLPPILGAAPQVWVQATLSTHDPSQERQSFGDVLKGARITARLPGEVVEPIARAGEIHADVHLNLPPALRSRPAVLYVIGRPLSGSPSASLDRGPVALPAGAKLAFSIGIEEPGWESGWPAVTFRIVAK